LTVAIIAGYIVALRAVKGDSFDKTMQMFVATIAFMILLAVVFICYWKPSSDYVYNRWNEIDALKRQQFEKETGITLKEGQVTK